MADKEQIRERSDIVEIVGNFVPLTRKGKTYSGLCPFHQEKSASFHVLDGKGIFNCFGCGEKGDIFGLAMKLDGTSFPETVARLAEFAGVPLA